MSRGVREAADLTGETSLAVAMLIESPICVAPGKHPRANFHRWHSMDQINEGVCRGICPVCVETSTVVPRIAAKGRWGCSAEFLAFFRTNFDEGPQAIPRRLS